VTRIIDVINKTTPFFEARGVENPRLNVELLLSHVLKKKRLELYLEFERELDEQTLEKLRELVKRRAAGEPIQYITGTTEFFGLEFFVDKRVLIPRPETEILVAEVLQELKNRGKILQKIVDVGTGSGAIAVALAKNLPENAEIFALDVSADALEVAKSNAKKHGVEKNVRFLKSDLLQNLPSDLRADAIVTNPPYIATEELASLPKEVGAFEPKAALVGGSRGLEVIGRLVAQSHAILARGEGFLALEIGAGQAADVAQILAEHGFNVAKIVKDLAGHERVVVANA
jgi:release factor glutamine methyltransferase